MRCKMVYKANILGSKPCYLSGWDSNGNLIFSTDGVYSCVFSNEGYCKDLISFIMAHGGDRYDGEWSVECKGTFALFLTSEASFDEFKRYVKSVPLDSFSLFGITYSLSTYSYVKEFLNGDDTSFDYINYSFDMSNFFAYKGLSDDDIFSDFSSSDGNTEHNNLYGMFGEIGDRGTHSSSGDFGCIEINNDLNSEDEVADDDNLGIFEYDEDFEPLNGTSEMHKDTMSDDVYEDTEDNVVYDDISDSVYDNSDSVKPCKVRLVRVKKRTDANLKVPNRTHVKFNRRSRHFNIAN